MEYTFPVRTRRAVPRLIAILVLLGSGSLLFSGLQLVRNEDLYSPTIFDPMIKRGAYWWTVGGDAGSPCSAYVRSKLLFGSEVLLSFHGRLNVSYRGRTFPASFELRTIFSPYRFLKRVFFRLDSSECKLKMRSTRTGNEIAGSSECFGENRSHIFAAPKGVLLLERQGRETLVLTRQLARLFVLAARDDGSPRYTFAEADREMLKECRAALERGASLNIDGYAEYFGERAHE